jgi:hypothetical protein
MAGKIWARGSMVVGSTYDVREVLKACASQLGIRMRWDGAQKGWDCGTRRDAERVLSLLSGRGTGVQVLMGAIGPQKAHRDDYNQVIAEMSGRA